MLICRFSLQDPYYVECEGRIYEIGTTGTPIEIPYEIDINLRIAELKMTKNLFESELLKLDYSSRSSSREITSIRRECENIKKELQCCQEDLEAYSRELPVCDNLLNEL